MPRDAQGNYTLPGGNPVVTGTVITSTWANPTMADIGNELSNSLSRDGQGGMRVPFENFDGTENAPGITFANEPTLGFYRASNGILGVSGQGDTIAFFKAASGNVSVEGPEPLVDADLTRKDWVEATIAAAIAQNNLDAYPVGSFKIGPDPTSYLGGTWSQLPEGTFLMNTVGGADAAGGSNDAVVVAHDHTINHDHAAFTSGNDSPDHSHGFALPLSGNADGPNNLTGGNGGSTLVNGTNGANTRHQHSINVPNYNGSSGSKGVSGTNLNKPKYKGVEVWERTA